MEPVTIVDLWLPILAAGLATHVLSTLAWTVLPHHKPEWRALPYNDTLEDKLASGSVVTGEQYLLTEGAQGDLDPAKCRGTLVLWSHKPNMGANIAMTLTFFIATSLVIGYLASIPFTRETPSIDIFRFATTAALLAHATTGLPGVIWFRAKFLMNLLDGVAYALATGLAFAWLWPR